MSSLNKSKTFSRLQNASSVIVSPNPYPGCPPLPPDTLLSGNPWSGLGKGRGGAMFGSVGAQNTFHHFCRFLSPRHSVTHICFLSVAGRLQQKVDGLHSLRIFCRVTPVPLSYKTNKHFIFQRCKWQRRRWWCCCLSSSWEVVTASVALFCNSTQRQLRAFSRWKGNLKINTNAPFSHRYHLRPVYLSEYHIL